MLALVLCGTCFALPLPFGGGEIISHCLLHCLLQSRKKSCPAHHRAVKDRRNSRISRKFEISRTFEWRCAEHAAHATQQPPDECTTCCTSSRDQAAPSWQGILATHTLQHALTTSHHITRSPQQSQSTSTQHA